MATTFTWPTPGCHETRAGFSHREMLILFYSRRPGGHDNPFSRSVQMESAGMNQPALRYEAIAGCAFSAALTLATLGGCSDPSGVSGQGAVTRPLIVQGNMEAVTPADFETVTKRDVWIPLRDGTRLLADITLPVHRTRSDTHDRPQFSGRTQQLGRAAHLPGRGAAGPQSDDGHF